MEILFFILLAVAVIAWQVVRGQRLDEDWARTARALGLRHVGGLGKQRVISGRLGADRVSVKTEHRGDDDGHTVTVYRYRYRGGPRFGLEFRAEGFWSKLRKMFGTDDIRTGARSFDDAVVVRGRQARRVTQYLTPERRARIRSMLVSNRSCVISNSAITMERLGLDSGDRVRTVLKRMRALVEVLRVPDTDTEPPPMPIDLALQAQREGRLDDASQHLDAARQSGADEEEVIALQHELEGRAAPDIPEAVVEPVPQPMPAAATAPDVELVTVEPATVEPATVEPADAIGLDQQAVCDALFAPTLSSEDAHALFEQNYQGLDVSWSGKLARIEPYYHDRVFGDGPGARAVVEVAQVSAGMSYTATVQAIVQLSANAATEIPVTYGTEVELSGRLVRCDPMVRNVYFEAGSCRAS